MDSNEYLDFKFENLPEDFEHTFDGVTYHMHLYYTRWSDSFYLDIKDENDVPIVMGEKLVYGEWIWASVNDQRLPLIMMKPVDADGEEDTVSALNFPVSVHVYISDGEYTDDVISLDDDVSMLDEDTMGDDDNQNSVTDADVNLYGNDPTVGGDLR